MPRDELEYPCYLPVVKTIRNERKLSPAQVYAALPKEKGAFLLESAVIGEKIARYSFLGSNPERRIAVKDSLLKDNGRELQVKDPLRYLRSVMQGLGQSREGLPPFSGGLLGYLAYDAVRYFEDIGDRARDELSQLDAEFLLVRDLIAFDHWRDEILLISNMKLSSEEEMQEEREKALAGIARMEEALKEAEKRDVPNPAGKAQLEVKSNLGREEFEQAVQKAKEHIHAGDIFQVVLSQRFQVKGDFNPFTTYLALKRINPSPYMYLLELGETKVIGSSPEILVKVKEREVTVRPIAGTRPRGRDIIEDEALSREMLNDEKERAEHVMLVDLGRNDVGKVARFGTVEVTEFFTVEKYSHVQHIVSNVRGELREGLDCFDALKASFPAGTVTGAPKVRAMEIIEELEPSRRGIYAGSVGYFSFDGNMDFAIAIRTILLQGQAAYVQAGAGIVADSAPEREWRESVNKGRGMLKALERTGG